MDTKPLLDEALKGSQQAIGRLISLVEDQVPEGHALLRQLHKRTGQAYIVGVTGPPGAGKSTLVDVLTKILRRQGKRVAIVAVDPTSPFTGGALLGDRIRMQDHATDPGVFIRSMATRGSLGGLAPATSDAVRILDALGYDFVFIETVGTGQAEVDIVGAADTVVIALVPGLGDAVQTMKAGIMEIGDVFVVNKADQGDADRSITEIKMMLGLRPHLTWHPPALKTVATDGSGVEAVLESIEAHRKHLSERGLLAAKRRDRRAAEILRVVETRIRDRALDSATRSGKLEALARRVESGEIDPHTAADELLTMHLDHVGIAVHSIEAASKLYRGFLKLGDGEQEEISGEHVRVAFFDAGGARIELLEPIGTDGTLARFLAARGEGMHHLAFVVRDLRSALEEAGAAGYRPLDEKPRRGSGGRLIAFIHPRTTHGVLIELIQAV